MTDAPEVMWVFPKKDWFNAGASTHPIAVRKGAKDVKYIRSDLADLGERSKEMENALVRWVDFGKYLDSEYIMKFYANDSVAITRAIRETEELLQRLKEKKND